jgi:hypothetical protein
MPNKPPAALLLLLLLGGGCEELGGWPAGLDLHSAAWQAAMGGGTTADDDIVK